MRSGRARRSPGRSAMSSPRATACSAPRRNGRDSSASARRQRSVRAARPKSWRAGRPRRRPALRPRRRPAQRQRSRPGWKPRSRHARRPPTQPLRRWRKLHRPSRPRLRRAQLSRTRCCKPRSRRCCKLNSRRVRMPPTQPPNRRGSKPRPRRLRMPLTRPLPNRQTPPRGWRLRRLPRPRLLRSRMSCRWRSPSPFPSRRLSRSPSSSPRTRLSPLPTPMPLPQPTGPPRRQHECDHRAGRAGTEAREGVIQSYIHAGNKIGVLVEVNCQTDFVARNDRFVEFARDLALHIAAAAPLAVTEDEVPVEDREREERIATEQSADRPENVRERIVKGKLDKWLDEVVLLRQKHVNTDKHENQTIEELRAALSAETRENIVVRRFSRFAVGG